MQIKTVGVIGAGTMGNGIAQVCATAGLAVVLIDVSSEALTKCMNTLSANLDRLVKKEQLSADAKTTALSRIKTTTDYAELGNVEFVIEAATENKGLKTKILQSLVQVLPPHGIIATNTSSISITELASTTSRPERFIGVHFFNPVPIMGLVEIIRGLQTSHETQDAAESLVKTLGKTPIVVKNSAGFAVNRILCPMLNEAIFVLQEGVASAGEIDQGMKLGCSHPIGPLALADLIGLDTLLAIMEVLYANFGDTKYRPAPLLKEMVAAGYLGRKSGKGFFSYAK